MSDDASTDMGIGLVLDCCDPAALARFWAGALHYVNVGAVENYVLLVPDGRPGPNLLLQQVPEDKTVKNRMHLDLHVGADHVDDEVRRLEGLGATYAWTSDDRGPRCITLRDPEGNELCVS